MRCLEGADLRDQFKDVSMVLTAAVKAVDKRFTQHEEKIEELVSDNTKELKRSMSDIDERLSKKVKRVLASVEVLKNQLCPHTQMLDNPLNTPIKHLLAFMMAVGPATTNKDGITPFFYFVNFPNRPVTKDNTCVVISKAMLRLITFFTNNFSPPVASGFQTKLDKVIYNSLGSIAAGLTNREKLKMQRRFPTKMYKTNGTFICTASSLARLIGIIHSKETDGNGVIVAESKFNLISEVSKNGTLQITKCSGVPDKRCAAMGKKMRKLEPVDIDDTVADMKAVSSPEDMWNEYSKRLQWNKPASFNYLSDPSFRHGVDMIREAMGKPSAFEDNDTPSHIGAFFEPVEDVTVAPEDIVERDHFLNAVNQLREDEENEG